MADVAEEDVGRIIYDYHFYTYNWYISGSTKVDSILDYCTGYFGLGRDYYGYNDAFKTPDGFKFDLWVGQWSLATDFCALNLHGW
jgi:hypothetical protein